LNNIRLAAASAASNLATLAVEARAKELKAQART